MSKSPEDVKASHPHRAHSHDDFVSQLRFLKEAEKDAAAVLENARKTAAKIEANARGEAVEIAAKAAEAAVQEKNDVLTRGRNEIEKETGRMLAEAKSRAAKISETKLPEREAEKLAESIL